MQTARRKASNKPLVLSTVYALICLALSYLFLSLSIDKGNLFYYLLTLVFLVYFLKFGGRTLKGIYHGVISKK